MSAVNAREPLARPKRSARAWRPPTEAQRQPERAAARASGAWRQARRSELCHARQGRFMTSASTLKATKAATVATALRW
jgi:hypothetical protein